MFQTLAERIGARLLIARKQKGLSQKDVAAFTGLSQSQVSKFENGKETMSIVELELLCRACDLSMVEAVRDHGLEFCAEMTPTELRLLEAARRAPPSARDGLLQVLQIKRTHAPDRHAGALTKKPRSGRP